MTNGITAKGDHLGLKVNDIVKVRFLCDGNAFGFMSEVMHIQHFPYHLMFIKYPSNYECMKLRVTPRFKIYLPTSLSDASGALLASDATMLDISEGGCRLIVPAKDGVKFLPDVSYSITFLARTKELSVACDIRQLREGKDLHSLGLEFKNTSDSFRQELGLFIDFIKNNIRT